MQNPNKIKPHWRLCPKCGEKLRVYQTVNRDNYRRRKYLCAKCGYTIYRKEE